MDTDGAMLTREKFPEFKRLYEVAVAEHQTTFFFEGQLILTEYAGYVVLLVEGSAEWERRRKVGESLRKRVNRKER